MADERTILRPAPDVLTGERIVVRGLTDEDAEAIYDAIGESSEHLRPWMPWYNQHASVEDTLAFIRRTQVEWILREGFGMGSFGHDGRFLGGAGLGVHGWEVPAFEIGYWIRQTEEGKGYVSEAARLLTACAFETLGAQRVVIRCDVRNRRSAAVAERLGYVLEGTARRLIRDTTGNLADMRWYALLPDDYRRVRRDW